MAHISAPAFQTDRLKGSRYELGQGHPPASPLAVDDGMVWRISPEGVKTAAATGIGDPNAFLVLKDRSFLVWDDAVDRIYRVAGGKTQLWSTAELSKRSRLLARPVHRLRRTDLQRIEADQARRPHLGPDGLTTDDKGRIYIADNGSGGILRYDPKAGAAIVIAKGMRGVASLVFGEGRFDRTAPYATTTARGGGTIWKVRVGARGLKPYR